MARTFPNSIYRLAGRSTSKMHSTCLIVSSGPTTTSMWTFDLLTRKVDIISILTSMQASYRLIWEPNSICPPRTTSRRSLSIKRRADRWLQKSKTFKQWSTQGISLDCVTRRQSAACRLRPAKVTRAIIWWQELSRGWIPKVSGALDSAIEWITRGLLAHPLR